MSDIDFESLLRECYLNAELSGDLSTKNGSLLFDPSAMKVVAFGRNEIPAPSASVPSRYHRPDKYQWTEHAERAAIYAAARAGVQTQGLTMVCCWAACTDCARAIVLSGIDRLVRHSIPQHSSREDWNKSIAVADQILTESGVEVVNVTAKLGVSMFFDGQWIEV